MNAEEIKAGEEFQKCAEFHGHICPGLAIGYRAAKEGLRRLKENRSVDEEIVAVVETDACSVDAIQVLTGCTFGKGNFFYRDNGKHVYTLLSRNSGKGVRVSLKAGAIEPTDRQRAVAEKVHSGEATDEDREELEAVRTERMNDILTKPVEDIFDVKEIEAEIPQRAVVEPSRPCSRCGEPTMGSKLGLKDGVYLCRDCLNRG